MNYNYLQKKNNNSQFVNNKETFNKRIFDRNKLHTEIKREQNVMPKYMSENYSINRKKAQSIFNKRIIPEITKKPIVDFVNFRDNEINKFNSSKKKKITSFNNIDREVSFLKKINKNSKEVKFKKTILNNLSKNPYGNFNNNLVIPEKIDFSKSNLAFFINENNK